MSLKPGSYAGAMATFTNLAGRTNAVAGADLSLKFKGSHQVTGFVLGVDHRRSGRGRPSSGVGAAGQLQLQLAARRTCQTQVEHYDRDFVMDTAFLNRIGITGGWGYVDYSFYPDKDKHSWIRRITPFTFLQGGRDRVQDGDEYVSVTGVRLSFTRQGFFRVDKSFGAGAVAGPRVRERPRGGCSATCSCSGGCGPTATSTGATRSTTTRSIRSWAGR